VNGATWAGHSIFYFFKGKLSTHQSEFQQPLATQSQTKLIKCLTQTWMWSVESSYLQFTVAFCKLQLCLFLLSAYNVLQLEFCVNFWFIPCMLHVCPISNSIV
jgi:hypothetical protein